MWSWLSGRSSVRSTHRKRRAHALKYLALTGVADAADQLPAEMSLGMQQCVSLARALSLEPELLLLDEPFSMLDSLTRLDLQDTLLGAWEQDRKIVVMVTHDVDEALYLADRIVLMTDGPAAHVGDIMTVPFARPRDRRRRPRTPRLPAARQSIIDFLENHAGQSVATRT
jgi:ABC-type nitrate/sulfonate/bicarbonate transport system ATPase subunit